MTAPTEIVVGLSSLNTLARVVRAALRHGTTRLPVELVPPEGKEFLFHFEAQGYTRRVSVIGERAGDADDALVPFRFRPRTRVQAAELFLISEEIVVPTDTVPPPEDLPQSMPPPGPSMRPGSGRPGSMPPSEDTIVEMCHVDNFGVVASVPPPDQPRNSGVREASPSIPVEALDAAWEQTADEKPMIPPAPPAPAPAPVSVKRGDPLLERQIAGKYQLETLLGAGGAGAVYKAMHVDLGRVVAVKVLHAQNQHEAQFVKRFKAEARAASRLDHRNVTRVLDFGQEPDGLLYLVMEYVAGKSLETILQTEGRLPQVRVVDIGIQVCNALVLAHKEGIIHRDIKPENLLLVPALDDDLIATDLVKVCDFGMAKLKKGDGEELTIGGMICGSPAYMSPEQIRGGTLDARTDIYAIGMTMYEALTGAHPFTANTLVELFMKHENEPPRPPTALVPDLDPLLEDVLLKTLAKRPEQRHDSVAMLRMELREIAEELKDQAPPSSAVGSAG